MDAQRTNGITVHCHCVLDHLSQRCARSFDPRLFGWIYHIGMDCGSRPSGRWIDCGRGRQVCRQCPESLCHVVFHCHFVYHCGIYERLSSQSIVPGRSESSRHGHGHVLVTRTQKQTSLTTCGRCSPSQFDDKSQKIQSSHVITHVHVVFDIIKLLHSGNSFYFFDDDDNSATVSISSTNGPMSWPVARLAQFHLNFPFTRTFPHWNSTTEPV